MSIEDFAGRYGVFQPEDTAFLKSIYDDIIAQQLAPSDKSALAVELLYLFRNGVKDRDELYKAALLPIKNRSEGYALPLQSGQ
jgi:hypothetical protein